MAGSINLMYSLPVRAKSADPANLGTADCAYICHCDDGCDYAVKNGSSGKYVAHSEWFCKHLGDAVGIASPECRLVEVNGETAFGSRWESGHKPEDWWIRTKNGEIDKNRIASPISRIFAFDLFVNNVDRHTNNYIVRPQANDNWSLLAFDHSRAWLATGQPFDENIMDPNSATRKNFRFINRYLNGIHDMAESLFVLENLAKVDTQLINQILTQQSEDWLSESEAEDIRNFWVSDNFTARVERIQKGFRDNEFI